jgi:hypothetical protein
MTSCIKLWHKTNSSNEYVKMKNCDDMDQIVPCEWNSTHGWYWPNGMISSYEWDYMIKMKLTTKMKWIA